jgi:hypothetical protein
MTPRRPGPPARRERPAPRPAAQSAPRPSRFSYPRALRTCAILGVGLRLTLFWVNPPDNYVDNHYEPILWIMQKGSLPPKDALWQAYQPPVFYVVSAAVGTLERNAGASPPTVYKTLQFVSALFGILALWVIFKILKRVPISDFARLVAFASVCFLPQHIYLTALHSNDTAAGLGVALSAWLMLLARERGFPPWLSLLLCATTTLTLFTKYTGFVALPMMMALVLPELARPAESTRRGRAVTLWLLLLVPLFALGAYALANLARYGQALPWNTAFLDPSKTQPHAPGGMSFLTFKPWTCIATPMLAPWNLDSFWTLIHARMWWDMEPKFIYFLDQNRAWWEHYYAWLRGEQPFPAGFPWTPFTRFTGAALITLGLVPLGLMLAGLIRSVRGGFHVAIAEGRRRWTGMQIFAALLLSNAAGVVYLTMRSPVYSSVKAIYFLVALPAFAAYIGLGFMALERHRWARALVVGALAALFALVAFHILELGLARGFRIGA